MENIPNIIDFDLALSNLLRQAEQEGKTQLIVNSGELHRQVGGYPAYQNRIVTCCGAMRKIMIEGDQILHQPPQGNGASLDIQYILPRAIAQRHFTAYHNIDREGEYPFKHTETKIIHKSTRHRKHIQKTIGHRIWVIGGRKIDNRNRYTLLSFFLPDTIEEIAVGDYDIIGKGVVFKPPVDLSSESWIADLPKDQYNFSLGISEIKNSNIIAGLLSAENRLQISDFSLPDEIPADEEFIEGAVKQITVNVYERDSKARQACINKWGAVCQVCTFNFEGTYGEIGKGYIHVHHVKPLHMIRKEYKVDPINDLQPVCPNCHAMLHRQNPPLSIDQLRAMLRK